MNHSSGLPPKFFAASHPEDETLIKETLAKNAKLRAERLANGAWEFHAAALTELRDKFRNLQDSEVADWAHIHTEEAHRAALRFLSNMQGVPRVTLVEGKKHVVFSPIGSLVECSHPAHVYNGEKEQPRMYGLVTPRGVRDVFADAKGYYCVKSGEVVARKDVYGRAVFPQPKP